jgi:hypothetical protein
MRTAIMRRALEAVDPDANKVLLSPAPPFDWVPPGQIVPLKFGIWIDGFQSPAHNCNLVVWSPVDD